MQKPIFNRWALFVDKRLNESFINIEGSILGCPTSEYISPGDGDTRWYKAIISICLGE